MEKVTRPVPSLGSSRLHSLRRQLAIIFLLFNSPSGLPDVIGIGWGHCGGILPPHP